jgi:hypothetical protein
MSLSEWAAAQLKKSGTDQVTTTSVLRLIELWDTMSFGSDVERRDNVLNLFGELARSHALAASDPTPYTWISANTAKPRQHDRVRVRLDAYTGETGTMLNGEEGVVARIARGTLVIAMDIGGVIHINPSLLETQVPVT